MARKFGLLFSIIFLSVFIGSFLRMVEFNLAQTPVKNEALVFDNQIPPANQIPTTLPARVAIWYDAWNEESDNLPALAEGNFVTHVLIANLDFNEQPISSMASKVAAVKAVGLIPIWGRWLFFQDGKNATLPEAAPFLNGNSDG